jgi:hypothetical protein
MKKQLVAALFLLITVLFVAWYFYQECNRPVSVQATVEQLS